MVHLLLGHQLWWILHDFKTKPFQLTFHQNLTLANFSTFEVHFHLGEPSVFWTSFKKCSLSILCVICRFFSICVKALQFPLHNLKQPFFMFARHRHIFPCQFQRFYSSFLSVHGSNFASIISADSGIEFWNRRSVLWNITVLCMASLKLSAFLLVFLRILKPAFKAF